MLTVMFYQPALEVAKSRQVIKCTPRIRNFNPFIDFKASVE